MSSQMILDIKRNIPEVVPRFQYLISKPALKNLESQEGCDEKWNVASPPTATFHDFWPLLVEYQQNHQQANIYIEYCIVPVVFPLGHVTIFVVQCSTFKRDLQQLLDLRNKQMIQQTGVFRPLKQQGAHSVQSK